MEKDNLLIIFLKNPVKGKVKTRLSKDLGDSNALRVYKGLLEHINSITKNVNTSKWVCYSDFIDEDDIWSNELYSKHQQKGDDLGERMANCFKDGFASGYKNIVLIGVDCLDINTEYLNSAFEALTNSNFVLGPTLDGGYFLVGMNSFYKEIFKGIIWSTETVFSETTNKIEEAGFTYKTLGLLSDIDNIEDVKKYEYFKSFIK